MWNKTTDTLPRISRQYYSNKDKIYYDEYYPVLAVLTEGKILVMTYEQWDENTNPTWYSDCSEKWNYDNDEVFAWTKLPAYNKEI